MADTVILGPFYGQANFQEYDWLCRRLEEESVNRDKAGYQLAENDKVYERELALEVIRIMETEKQTITYARVAAKANEYISDLKFARDCSQVLYDACKENINIIKKRLGFVQSSIERDWANVRYVQ